MIPTPRGFRRVDVGEDVLLLPADERTGVIRYRERLPGGLPVHALIAGQLADDPQFQVDSTEDVEHFVTFEGERAAMVTVRGMLDGARVERHIGYVVAEDVHARVSALVRAGTELDTGTGDLTRGMREVVRALVERVVLGLGDRRRRPLYAPPRDWREHVIGLRTEWIRRDFPLDPSCITVWPAVPGALPAMPPPVVNAPGVVGLWPLQTAGGLTGWTWRHEGQFADGTPRVRDLVLLADGRYRVAVRLDTEPSRHERCSGDLHDVVDSLQVPRAPREGPPETPGFEHWSE